MNVLEATVALRDRTLVDVVDLALRFLAEHKKRFAFLSFWVLVPGVLVSWAIGEMLGWVWGWIFAGIGVLVAQAPFTTLAARLLFADQLTTREALRDSLRGFPTLIFVRSLQATAVAVASTLLLLPGVWLAAAFLFLPEILALEKTPLAASWTRAQRMSSGQMGDAIMTTLLLFCAFAAAPFLADAAGRSILEDVLEIAPPASLMKSGGGALAMIGFWSCVPLAAVARFFVYINLRTRAEGWDIQTRFAALVARAALAEATP